MAKFITRDHILDLDAHNYITEAVEHFQQMQAGFLYSCFRKYGFTKEWLHDPVNIKRVKITRYEKPGTIYYIDRCSVDDMDIFSIAVDMTEDGRGFFFKMSPHQNPTEIRKLFGFTVEEDSDEPD